jgi:hypothetical protein
LKAVEAVVNGSRVLLNQAQRVAQSGRLFQFIAHGAKEEKQIVVDQGNSTIYTMKAQEMRESQADRREWTKSNVAT